MTPELIERNYRAQIAFQKKRAFHRWQISGYSDLAAWEEFLLMLTTGIEFNQRLREIKTRAH